MKKTSLALYAITLVLGCTSLLAQSGASTEDQQVSSTDNTRLTEANSGITMDLSLGSNLEVSLLSQTSSTGYEWSFDTGTSKILALQGDPTFQKEYTSPVYAPGYTGPRSTLVTMMDQEVWCFQGAALGTTTLAFYYQRPWETGTPAKVITFTINVVK